jgi:GNAT superfamily N-acetyltransferase
LTTADKITIRLAEAADFDAVVRVCGEALRWTDGGRDADFFAWKHLDNPFGPSPIWLAEHDGAVVGVRAMMRWELRRPDGTRWSMARAVDTATLPDYQGRGIFSRLTRAAVSELTADQVAAIFNTPNDQSRPGYLKLGWSELGRVPVTVRVRSPRGLVIMARSKTAAEKWGLPTTAGLDPVQALADDDEITALLARQPSPEGWATPVTVAYLRWRTGFDPLACRVQLLGASPAEGLIVFRLRQRGPLRQLSLLHLVTPDRSSGRLRRAVGKLLADTGADVALASGRVPGIRCGLLPLPGAGPLLTWRPLAQEGVPDLDMLELPLGALELF